MDLVEMWTPGVRTGGGVGGGSSGPGELVFGLEGVWVHLQTLTEHGGP